MDMWAFAASALIFSRSADAMRVLNLISFFIINDLSEMISLVPSESWGASSGSGLLPENRVWGHAPPSAFGRAAALPQTRQMRCWLSAAQAAYHSFPSLPPTKTRSLRCTAFFPPKPLRWVSAGALLGAVIKTPVLYFLHFCVGGITYPPVAVAVSEQPGAGFVSAEKTAFSERVLCADGHAVPSCTQCFFGTSVWGVVSLPSACASCC